MGDGARRRPSGGGGQKDRYEKSASKERGRDDPTDAAIPMEGMVPLKKQKQQQLENQRLVLGSLPAARRLSMGVADKATPQKDQTERWDYSTGDRPPLFPVVQTSTASAPTPHNELPQEEVGTVEGAGLRSTILEQQQRIDQLENEQIQMITAVVARHYQKEVTWTKKRKRCVDKINELRKTSLETDERHRDLVVKCDSLEKERAATEASSSLNTNNNSVWSRHLHNDRDVADLKEKLPTIAEEEIEEEIKSLRLEKLSIEEKAYEARVEISVAKLQKKNKNLLASKSDNNEAESKRSTKEGVTVAQLEAAYSDLVAMMKACHEAAMEHKEEHKKKVEILRIRINFLEKFLELAEKKSRLLETATTQEKMHNIIEELVAKKEGKKRKELEEKKRRGKRGKN